MSISSLFNISGAGLSVQRDRMDVINENIANISTTRTPEGGPYKPKEISIAAKKMKDFTSDFNALKKDEDPKHRLRLRKSEASHSSL
ncbi:MAG: hypothetical protein IPJ69_02965 [Deltaproteobacteria bacterium]|nr:MAG: hypothetical protein IPJ69_02965 [Deltaproteobacteria bacterium]